ncbi:MAG: diguanylate cyclase [Endomicrobia bacterium]|nr:diguanylate cyclase [Endomicrobiia bacterium]
MYNLPKYYSAVGLLTYLQCPYKFKLLYIDRVGSLYKKVKPYQAVGDTIHKVLSIFFRIENIKERTFEKLISLLDEHWISEGYTTKEQETEYKHNAVYWLKNFYENNDITITPLYTEEFFRVEIEKFFLTGKIDRIDNIGDGVEIIDYKTGGYIPAQEDFEKDLQMDVYALCCWQQYKLFPKKVSQIFLQHNYKISSEKTYENLQEMKTKVVNIINTIHSDTEFNPSENNLCSYCDFLTICPEMGMGIKIVKEKQLQQDFKTITKKLEQTINDLNLLNQISLDIAENIELQNLIMSIPRFIQGLGKAKKILFYLYDDENKHFVLQNIQDNPDVERIIPKNKMFNMLNISEDKLPDKPIRSTENKTIQEFFSHQDKEMILFPLISRNKLLGFLLVAEKIDYSEFTNYDISLLQSLISHIAVALNNAQLYELAITDGLTKLYIQRYFLSRLEYEILRVRRYNTVFSLLMIDIDFFKKINDTYGHLTGDEVLKTVAKILLSCVRQTDIVCRYGGEEFAVMLIECGREWAQKIALRIKDRIETAEIKIEDKIIKITVSIGVETYYEGLSGKDIIEHADKALYMAKSLGRNKVVVYDKSFVIQ